MDRGKRISAAFVLTLAGLIAMMPPLTGLFQWRTRAFGLPVEVIYLFAVWAALVLGAVLLARVMPADPPSSDAMGRDG
ncbi:hypothetical protein VE25_03260 [Devosia geojensis]|uniref:Uncharacterized protein n=1 Tax=Devosia geojensis TaxID=443610 RepID=A0A0F5FY77_9HYPH|nr:hypothetical protein [Devosia geojensis]KKB13117.1 hypothetical protein VE25_03260 [Devosia geojensis]